MLKSFSGKLVVVLLISMTAWGSALADQALVMEYQREFSLIAEADNSVDVRLFKDGMVEIHYPFFMRLAGDYQYQLEAAEFDRLLRNLWQLGVNDFDANAVNRALQLEQQAAFEAAQLPGQSVTVVTDPEITRIRLADAALSRSAENENSYSFTGVRENAALYPQVNALAGLAEALEILDGLASDARMQRIEVSE